MVKKLDFWCTLSDANLWLCEIGFENWSILYLQYYCYKEQITVCCSTTTMLKAKLSYKIIRQYEQLIICIVIQRLYINVSHQYYQSIKTHKARQFLQEISGNLQLWTLLKLINNSSTALQGTLYLQCWSVVKAVWFNIKLNFTWWWYGQSTFQGELQ